MDMQMVVSLLLGCKVEAGEDFPGISQGGSWPEYAIGIKLKFSF